VTWRLVGVQGNLVSATCAFLLLAACTGPRWAHDAVNSVDIGLWLLTVRSMTAGWPHALDVQAEAEEWRDGRCGQCWQGTGVQYKLINAGLSVDSAAVSGAEQPFTLYRKYW